MKGLEQIKADERALEQRSKLAAIDKTTEVWVLRAKVELLEKALSELQSGVRGFAKTLRAWAVAAGGHTPSAIVASRLFELIGDEKSYVETEADIKQNAPT